jgi:hypothetical protein
MDTVYGLPTGRRAVGPGGNRSDRALPMKATVFWRFPAPSRPDVARWTIDGHWSVERS